MHQRFRLRRRADFDRLRRIGRRYVHPLVVLIVCEQSAGEEASSRFAFAAGRQIGSAPQRNRAKRLIRESVRQNLTQIKPNWNCLWLARSSTPNARFEEVESGVLELLGRAGLLQTPEQG